MKRYLLCCVAFLFVLVADMHAQSVTLSCTGTTGSFKSGYVTSSGAVTDGNMVVSNGTGTPKGWAVFDLSTVSLPPTAIITYVSLRINTMSVTGTGTPSCVIRGTSSDVSTLASSGQGTTLYSTIANAPLLDVSNWGFSTGAFNIGFNSAGISLVANNLSGVISLGYSLTTSARVYNLSGYGAATSEQPMLTINYTVPCSSVPTPATASAPASVCANAAIYLSASGLSSVYGVIHQWQFSPAGMNTWSPITGATSSSYQYWDGITTATDFRLVSTCTSTTAQSPSNVVTVGLTPFSNCYCASASSNTTGMDITGLTIGSYSNTSACNALAPGTGSAAGKYSNYTMLTPIALMQGVTVPVNISVGACTSGSKAVKIFIDYDHSGDFYDPGEEVFFGDAISSVTGVFTIPAGALLGTTRLRVVAALGSSPGGLNPCGSYSFGETEDYLVDISAPGSCSGTPLTPVIAVTDQSVCPGFDIKFNASNPTVSGSIIYQWQSSPGGTNTWTSIPGATDFLYTSPGVPGNTDFRLRATCTSTSAQAFSNTIAITANWNCYCTPSSTSNPFSKITGVSLQGLNNISGTPTSGYTDYTALQLSGALPIPAIDLNGWPSLTVTLGSHAPQYCAVWIDADQNGVFDSYDLMYDQNYGLSTVVFPLALSDTFTGLTKMRISASHTEFDYSIGCGSDGEIEDYFVNIVSSLPSCSGFPAPMTISSPASVCAGSDFYITAPGYSVDSGMTFQWQSSPQGANTWTNIVDADRFYCHVYGMGNSAKDYRCVVTCATTGNSTTSNVATVSAGLSHDCYCIPSHDETSYYNTTITNLKFAGIDNSSGYPYNYPWIYPYLFYPLTATVTTGVSYPMTVNLDWWQTSQETTILAWIDFDQDGVFESTEMDVVGSGIEDETITYTGSVAIPANAKPGTTYMRVRTNLTGYNNDDPCEHFTDGETEDYIVNIISAYTPTASITTSSSTICAGTQTTFTTSLTNGGTAPMYQWRLNGANIPGATSSTYTTTTLANGNTIDCIVTSAAIWNPKDTSNAIIMTVNPILVPTLSVAANATNICPGQTVNFTATPTNGGIDPYYLWLKNGGAVGTNGNTYTDNSLTASDTVSCVMATDAVCPSVPVVVSNKVGIALLSAVTPSVSIVSSATVIFPGTTVTFTATPVNGGTAPAYQWKKNGSNVGTNSNTYTDNTLNDGDIITCLLTSNAVCPSPQTVASNGIEMTVSASCLAQIEADGDTSLCPGDSTTLYAYSQATAFQWQSSLAGQNTWADIGGATNDYYVVYTPPANTEYRAIALCSGGAHTSNVVSILFNSTTGCYAAPFSSGGTGVMINNLSFGTINNNSSATNPVASPYYSFYAQVTNAIQGSYKSLGVTLSSAGVYSAARLSLWVDYNRNGMYETSEWQEVSNSAASGTTANVVVDIPVTASLGLTGMRIRSSAAGAANNAADAYSSISSGETEDYLVNIVAPLPITGNSIAADQAMCYNTQPVLLNGGIPTGGIDSFQYQWLESTTSAASGFAMATGNGNQQSYQPPLLTATTWYKRVTISGMHSDTSNIATMTVHPLPPAVVTANGSTSFCDGDSVIINASTAVGQNYQWYKDGIAMASATGASITGTQQATYHVAITDQHSCVNSSNAVPVTVYSLPQAIATTTGNTAFCAGDSVTINANAATGQSYQWFIDGALISTATNATINAHQQGAYFVLVTDMNSCADSSNAIQVTIHPLSIAVATAAGNTAFCDGDSVTINAGTATGQTYQWYKDGTAMTAATDTAITTALQGVYHVLVTDQNSCTDSSNMIQVIVHPLPIAAITVMGDTSLCQGDSVTLQSAAQQGYQWAENGSAIAGATNSTYTTSLSGSYTVMVTDGNSCEAASLAATIVVHPLPVPAITQAGQDLEAGSYVSYQWYLAGNAIPAATNSIYTPTADGDYTVIVTDSNGCDGESAIVSVTISAVVGVLKDEKIMVYPNPTNGLVVVERTDKKPLQGELAILDVTGKLLLQHNTHATRETIDIEHLAAGVYMVRYTTIDGKQGTVRITKR